MSIICDEVKNTALLKRSVMYGAKQFVYANINPRSRDKFPFPSDYKFLSCFLPKKYEQLCNRIQNFKVRPDDIWVVSFPKAGTTWTYNIVHQMRNNLDFSANFVLPASWFLERTILFENHKNDGDYERFTNEEDKNIDKFEAEKSNRVIKSHLPAHLLPKEVWTVKPKMIYVYRNVKDVAISMYHMFQDHKFIRLTGTMEDFFENFLNGHVIYGSFYNHVNSFLQLKQLENVLLIKYEDMLTDSIREIKRINNFLNFSYSDIQLMQLSEHCSFENMREKINFPIYPNFFRKGKAGGYQDEMSPEYVQRFEQ